MYDAIFPLNLVCSLGHQLPRRLLTHDKFLAIGASNLVGGIGLTESKLRKRSVKTSSIITGLDFELLYLLQVNGDLDLWDILGDVLFQRLDVDGLPHDASHSAVVVESMERICSVEMHMLELMSMCSRSYSKNHDGLSLVAHQAEAEALIPRQTQCQPMPISTWIYPHICRARAKQLLVLTCCRPSLLKAKDPTSCHVDWILGLRYF